MHHAPLLVDRGVYLGGLPDDSNPGLSLSIQLLLDALLSIRVVREGLHKVACLLEKAVVQKVAMQLGSKQWCANEMTQAQLVQISGCDKPACHQKRVN